MTRPKPCTNVQNHAKPRLKPAAKKKHKVKVEAKVSGMYEAKIKAETSFVPNPGLNFAKLPWQMW